MGKIYWNTITKDGPMTVILFRFRRGTLNLEQAAEAMLHVERKTAEFVAEKFSPNDDLEQKKIKCLMDATLKALNSYNVGYRNLVKLGEISPVFNKVLDQIEAEYGGTRITIKRITDPEYADTAQKLLKARDLRRKKLAQTP